MSKVFEQSGETAVFTCVHVMQEGDKILYVSHDAGGGDWQFLCERNDHLAEHGMMVALEEIILMEPTVLEIADMPTGCEAYREQVGGEWIIRRVAE